MTEPTTRPAHGWLDVLNQIEDSLAQSLHQAPTPDDSQPRVATTNEPLRKLNERMAQWQTSLDQAEGNASAASGQLGDIEAALRDWLNQAGKTRENLAEWVKGQR
jgi:hypothetical protein